MIIISLMLTLSDQDATRTSTDSFRMTGCGRSIESTVRHGRPTCHRMLGRNWIFRAERSAFVCRMLHSDSLALRRPDPATQPTDASYPKTLVCGVRDMGVVLMAWGDAMREYPQRETRGCDRSHVRMRPPDASASACDQCQRELPPGRMLVVIAPDSSFVHHDDPSLDGCRPVRACSDHLTELIDKARAGWVEEQLWFGRLARASSQPDMRGASLRQLARRHHCRRNDCTRRCDGTPGVPNRCDSCPAASRCPWRTSPCTGTARP